MVYPKITCQEKTNLKKCKFALQFANTGRNYAKHYKS